MYSFESGLEGFAFPNFPGSTSSLAQATSTGATEGVRSLAITKTDDDWTWDARVSMQGPQLQTLQAALAGKLADYVLEMDVTYLATSLPGGLSDMNMHVSFQPVGGSWTQAFPFADINSPVNQAFHVEIPLSSFSLPSSASGLEFHIGFDGNWPNGNNATVYIDRIALTDTTFVAPVEDADFDGDGDVDGRDFLAWQRGFGTGTTLAQGDANGDKTVDATDLAIWQSQYDNPANLASAAAAVPEPGSSVLLLGCAVVLLRRGDHAA